MCGNVFTRLASLALSMLALGLPFSKSATAQADPAPLEPMLDAVCKVEPMPPGYVAVGEMESPECKPSDPPHKNAWLVDKVRDKIVSCIPPDYASGYPPAISYMICRRVSAQQCTPSLDGTANAYELTLGATCTSPKVVTACTNRGKWDYAPSAYIEGRAGVGKKADWYNDELQRWKLSVILGDPECAKAENAHQVGLDRVNFVWKLDRGEPLPLCAEHNPASVSEIASYNWYGHATKVIVIRQFYTETCPPYYVDDKIQRLNAFVIQRLERDEWINRRVFMCASSLRKRDTSPPRIIPGSGGRVEEETAAEKYRLSDDFTIVQVLHDDRCGTGAEANAYYVQFKE
jgi:hypothetical protein